MARLLPPPIHLPEPLQRQLTTLFPTPQERDHFIVSSLEDALEKIQQGDNSLPQAIGGTLHLFCDGGSRGNPGQAAIACILEDPSRGQVLREYYERIGITTNNVAEYRALIEGLRIAKRYHPNALECFLDSELLVKQLNGEYRVKMPTLQPLFDTLRALANQLNQVKFHHIPREDNYRADALVNKALDEHPTPPLLPPTSSL